MGRGTVSPVSHIPHLVAWSLLCLLSTYIMNFVSLVHHLSFREGLFKQYIVKDFFHLTIKVEDVGSDRFEICVPL